MTRSQAKRTSQRATESIRKRAERRRDEIDDALRRRVERRALNYREAQSVRRVG